MNDEIKEMLDYMKKESNYKHLSFNATKLLLDYITNLQQENEELKKNQRYYKNGVFSLEYDKETLSDMVDDYKSRIEKAVEYIKEDACCGVIEDGNIVATRLLEDEEIDNLLNILQNGSDENE